jgi:thioredoxin 1
MSTIIIVLLTAFVGFIVLSQVLLRMRARAYQGKPLPVLSGPLGKSIAAADRSLLYFMSPQCGACRPWTARFTDMGKRNPNVHVVNVAEDLSLARALGVMATPTMVVVEKGKIAGYHVGTMPHSVLAQFA